MNDAVPLKKTKTPWYKRNKAYFQKYREENREKVRKISQKWNLSKNFGITVEDYQSMFEKQGGKCAICGIPQEQLSRALDIDHCHKSGKIRGLLCINCNRGLGYFKDSIDTMKVAMDYLAKHII